MASGQTGAAKRSVLVINPNSTKTMTEGLQTLISGHAFPHLKFDYLTAPSGPSSINNEEDGAESTKHCMPILTDEILQGYDAFIVACYSKHNLVESIEELSVVKKARKPVFGIFPASVDSSLRVIGAQEKYGIVSTGKYWESALSEAIKEMKRTEAYDRFAGVETTGLTATELHDVPAEIVHAKLTDATRRLVKSGDVGAVCLGCAGMAGMDETVRKACVLELGQAKGEAVKIIDGVIAAVELIDEQIGVSSTNVQVVFVPSGIFHRLQAFPTGYLPVQRCFDIIVSLNSWKRSWILSCAFMPFSQQRITQPSSRAVMLLDVKSSMQSLKHLSTMREYICMAQIWRCHLSSHAPLHDERINVSRRVCVDGRGPRGAGPLALPPAQPLSLAAPFNSFCTPFARLCIVAALSRAWPQFSESLARFTVLKTLLAQTPEARLSRRPPPTCPSCPARRPPLGYTIPCIAPKASIATGSKAPFPRRFAGHKLCCAPAAPSKEIQNCATDLTFLQHLSCCQTYQRFASASSQNCTPASVALLCATKSFFRSKTCLVVPASDMPATTQAPTGEPQPTGAEQPPTKGDLTSWWKKFKKSSSRKDDVKAQEAVLPAPGIFGVPLQTSIKYANVAISLIDENGQPFTYGYVPIVVAKCGVFLKEKGAERRIKELQASFNSPERYGKGLDWTGYTVHDAANILRRYFNQLPEPIVPLGFYDRFRNPLRNHQSQAVGEQDHQEPTEGDFNHDEAIKIYQNLITELPPLNRQLLLYILDLLAVFASKSETNRMTAPNLAAIFQPGILSHPDHDMAPKEYRLSQDVLIFLIVNQDHFIVGMEGTQADEKTIMENLLNRSASTASAGADSVRKFGGIRRNVSVSSRRSRQSVGNSASPVTPPPDSPFSTGGKSGSLARSNTLPSKRSGSNSPAVGTGRFQTEKSSDVKTATYVTRGPNSPSPLASNAMSTTPDNKSRVVSSQARNVSGSSTVQSSSDRVPSGRMSPHLRPIPTPRNRSQEGRKPNKLQKKRLDSNAPLSAQSSTASLSGASYPSSPAYLSRAVPDQIQEADATRLERLEALGPNRNLAEPQELKLDDPSPEQETEWHTPLAAQQATFSNEPIQEQSDSKLEHGDSRESRHSMNTLKPTRSPAGSIGSKSDGHGGYHSTNDADDHEGGERKEKKHSRWKFSMSKKDKEQKQTSSINRTTSTLGSSQGAKESSSSVGSINKPRRSFAEESSAPPLVQPAYEAGQGPAGGSGEKKGPLGWFKDKLQEIKERDDQFFEKRSKSPPPATQRGEATKSSQSLDASVVAEQVPAGTPAPAAYTATTQQAETEQGTPKGLGLS
ncbi:hypothetical protein FH972_021705 [Carpinus fangiana]|uniref:Rho-GAP domain-containing protein n=1 Tax=Carpinus fangiana TaxID=176857 RepID=A0A5N6KQG3_9ROSI|nr:hypothetical protein FH972_021705 [Carpinus fangiana]